MTIKTHGRMVTDNSIGISQLATQDGTDSQALVTDGSGSLRFATVGVGGSVGSSTYVEDIRVGNGTITKFTNSNAGTLQNGFSVSAAVEESVFVYVDGVAQPTGAYTLSSSGSGVGAGGNLDEITISPALVTGQQLRICHLGINTAIANNSITGAKIAMGADVAGDIIYYNGTDYQRLGIGTATQHLATNSGATAPEWVTPTTPPVATTTASGSVEIATQAEVTTGTDTARSITPATLAGANFLSGTVSQGGLSTALQTMTHTTPIEVTLYTLTGGDYTLGWTIKYQNNTSTTSFNAHLPPVGLVYKDANTDGPSGAENVITYNYPHVLGNTYKSRMMFYNGDTGLVTMRSRYIQASPPYDIGDGHCHTFLFALVNNSTGLIETMSESPDPCWAHNGPNCITPEYNRAGKSYRKIKTIDKSKSFEDPDRISSVEQEITCEFKNLDMALIPHPFIGTSLTGRSIILIDPCSDIALRADEMKEAGEEALDELFYKDYVRFSNEHIEGRCTPCNHGTDEVMVVKPTWKNSK